MNKWKRLFSRVLVIFFHICFFVDAGSASASDLNVNIQVPGNINSVQINNGNSQNYGDCLRGNGTIKKEQRSLKGFKKITVNGVFNLSIRQQQDFVVEVSCDANLYPHIQTQKVNDTLEIGTEQSICPKLPIRIRIGLPEFLELKSLGTDDISISNLDNKQFVVTVEGSSDIEIEGQTQTFTLNLDGSGDVDASGFRAQTVLVTADGSGDAIVHANKEIKAVLDGAGDVTYRGNPGRVIQKGDGTGDLSAQ